MKLSVFSILSLSVGATLAVGADALRSPSTTATDLAIQPATPRDPRANVYASASKPAPKPTPAPAIEPAEA